MFSVSTVTVILNYIKAKKKLIQQSTRLIAATLYRRLRLGCKINRKHIETARELMPGQIPLLSITKQVSALSLTLFLLRNR